MIETQKTRELLDACKEAGYTHVTVLCADKLVPASMARKKRASYNGWYYAGKPFKASDEQCRIISAEPRSHLDESVMHANGFPAIWHIARQLGLAHGCGCGESIPVHAVHIPDLTPGCYEL